VYTGVVDREKDMTASSKKPQVVHYQYGCMRTLGQVQTTDKTKVTCKHCLKLIRLAETELAAK
jgi:hypothetical protein